MAGEQYLIGNTPTEELEERAQSYRDTVSNGLSPDISYEEFYEIKECAAALRAVEKELELRRQGGRGVTSLGTVIRADDGSVVGIRDYDSNGASKIHLISGEIYNPME